MEALEKINKAQSGMLGKYSVLRTTALLHLRKHIPFHCARTVLLTVLTTLVEVVHPYHTPVHSTNGVVTLTPGWLGLN